MKKSLFIAVMSFPLMLLSQSNLFKPQLELLNTQIKAIEISHFLMNEPANKDFNSKFKVLEFWATWCRPCLKAVPHLNKLQATFKDSNIIFLSFTYERPRKAAEAFRKVKFKTVVVSDTTKAIHKKLRIDMNGTMPLPRTALIDDENKIVWYGSPEKLNDNLILRFLKKEPIPN